MIIKEWMLVVNKCRLKKILNRNILIFSIMQLGKKGKFKK